MPSHLHSDIAEPEEVTSLKHLTPVKGSSILYQAPRLSNEKVSSPGENRTVRLQDRGQPLKTTKPTGQPAPAQHASVAGKTGVVNRVPHMPLGNRHRPWPSRKVTKEEEVVKYMSTVPTYLKPQEKGDNVQDKALNFGVLDWGRLEKWTYLQKQVTNRRAGDSPSSSSASSSPFSASESSSHSDRSTDSPLGQRKQSPTSVVHQISSPKWRRSKMMDKQSSVPAVTDPGSRTHNKASVGNNHEKGKVSGSDVKDISHDKSPFPDSGSSICTSKDNDTSAFSHNNVNVQNGKLGEAENFRGWDELSDRFSVIESMWDHLQECVQERPTSCGSSMNNRRSGEIKRSSFSGNFPPNHIQFTTPPSRISYSCPLSSTSQGDEPTVSIGPLTRNEMLTANAKGKLVELGRFSDEFSERVVDMADKSQTEVKVAAAQRTELSPHHLLRAGLNRIRGPSLREASSKQQTEQVDFSDNCHNDSATSNRRRSSSPQRLLSAGLNFLRNSSSREGSTGKIRGGPVCSDNSPEDNAVSNIRSRRSPLRRIFDPLKSKNQIPFTGPITSLPSHRAQGVSDRDRIPIRDELKSANGPRRSSDTILNHSASPVSEAECSVHAEKQVTSARQALLKLAWKNGLPLFVFSSSDINILAATMERRSISQNNDFECIYTIFTAHEIKKKAGIWTSQVNKNKKHDLVYNVVGQIKVPSSKSTSDDSKNNFLVREFVLYGGEQISTARDCVSPQFKSELAAIVIQVQNGSPENDNCDAQQSSSCRDSSHVNSAEDEHSKETLEVEQRTEDSNLSSMLVILPSGIHGISCTGEPSPLIQRWKSGGSCDCGGWDEGCMLTILMNKIQESSTSDRACTTDGSHRIELFTQVRHLVFILLLTVDTSLLGFK